jgi:hypothetical protein
MKGSECLHLVGWFFDDFDRIEPRNNVKYARSGYMVDQTGQT